MSDSHVLIAVLVKFGSMPQWRHRIINRSEVSAEKKRLERLQIKEPRLLKIRVANA